MAGRPLKKKMFAELEAKAEAAKMTTPDFVYEHIASGGSVQSLADLLGVSRAYASRNLNANPEIAEALKRSRLDSAEAMAEQVVTIADKLAADMDNGLTVKHERIALLREQQSARKYLAAMTDPARYGKSDVTVNISIGDLHLDALRKRKAQPDIIDVTPEASDE